MATKTQTKSAKPAGKTLTVVQTGSFYGKGPGIQETLKGLGLGRPRRRRELQDTPEVRGMIDKVHHLVSVEEKK